MAPEVHPGQCVLVGNFVSLYAPLPRNAAYCNRHISCVGRHYLLNELVYDRIFLGFSKCNAIKRLRESVKIIHLDCCMFVFMVCSIVIKIPCASGVKIRQLAFRVFVLMKLGPCEPTRQHKRTSRCLCKMRCISTYMRCKQKML